MPVRHTRAPRSAPRAGRPRVHTRRRPVARLAPAALAIALAGSAACSDEDSTGPAQSTPHVDRVALVEHEGTRPVLVVYDAASGARTRVRFRDVVDPIPGNSPLVPRVTDDAILAMGKPSWSPDGTAIALAVTMAADQSEVVVVTVDGSAPTRVASVNTQIILTEIDWAPDGKSIAYGMSTSLHATRVALFVTDLVADRVTQLTAPGTITVVGSAVRFSEDGARVRYSHRTGELGGPLFEYVSAIEDVRIADRTATTIRADVAGLVQAIARTGDAALIVRTRGAAPDGRYVRTLGWWSLAGSDSTELYSGFVQYAALDPAERLASFVIDDGAAPSPVYTHHVISAARAGDRPKAEALPGAGVVTDYATPYVRR
jgi:WD40 repeat protein